MKRSDFNEQNNFFKEGKGWSMTFQRAAPWFKGTCLECENTLYIPLTIEELQALRSQRFCHRTIYLG